MPIIEKPSQLFTAIAETLRTTIPGLRAGTLQDFDGVGDQPWVLITFERDAPGNRANDGRIAHDLTVSMQVVLPGTALAACDLASELKHLVVNNRWNLPGDQCDLPMNIEGIASTFIHETRAYNAWTLSFTQTLYLGPTLLEDPLGIPKFARTWEVANIDDPAQYTALED
ncbi:hypothetical protein [Pseudomonas fluorescens]|uniref:Uncharacterized protein n=1 Tax=Pseudomonas fluorescens TaxID=294 RepID=A0A944DMW0_PSEFL|nr:hypothetical protein [Pseudomonas fluorescens]MBT2295458.1 hypothetical protein [Pseudomonas fluorescens]MBT2308862.1 hypothetical protein [Pseudomonas fluorescens]MBT2312385.1 hypothetical protein [Pseudomonas fluorescens]MBT2318048.1 hypothetical protein [Pseudomonas fluorescens]MBT2330938.1 hypothetical protein [Pseudomonas fluorescens]